MWKSAIICLSLANLCFLRSWQELHRLRIEAPQELRSGPILALLAGTLLNIVALAALLWVGITLVNRSHSPRILKAAQCAFLLVLVTPLDLLCRNLYSYSEPWLSGILLKSLWTAIVLLPVTGCVLLTVYENPSALRVARSAVLVVTPLLPLTAASLGWSIYNLPSELHAPRLAEPFPNTPARRLIWLIFDEFDYRIGFQVRPKTVKVPELERLRGESVFATNAYPPTGGETLKVLPTLMTGDLVKKSEWTMGRIEMELASGEKLSLSEAPTDRKSVV